jgi:hypothetical protein
MEVTLADDYAYVSTNTEFHIVNISDPLNPAITGGVLTPDGSGPVALRGDYAFVTQTYSDLKIINVSDRFNPFIAGSMDMANSATCIRLSGDNAFVGDDQLGCTGCRCVESLRSFHCRFH